MISAKNLVSEFTQGPGIIMFDVRYVCEDQLSATIRGSAETRRSTTVSTLF